MWSPSGAVGRGVLDNTCWSALFPLGADVTLGPKQWHKPSLGCSSCPQPNPVSPSCGCPSLLQASSPSPEWKGGKRKDSFLCKIVFYLGFCSFCQRRREGLWWKPGWKMWDAHSFFPRVLLSVPSGCLPSQDIQEWLLQLPRKARWGCVTKTHNTKEELVCSSAGEEPRAVCEDNVRSG